MASETAAVHLDEAEVAALDTHAKILRSIWMMSVHRKLSAAERRMLMQAIEAIEAITDPPVDYEPETPAEKGE